MTRSSGSSFLVAGAATVPAQERAHQPLPITSSSRAAGRRHWGGMDWAQYDLATIVAEIHAWLVAEAGYPLIPAGGIFTGSGRCPSSRTLQRRCRWRPASRWHANAACPKRSSRSTSRPARTKSSSTDLAHRLSDAGCATSSPASAPASVPIAEAYGYPPTLTAAAPTSRPAQTAGSRGPSRRAARLGDGQDLSVSMRNFDCWTWALTVPAQGHVPQARGRQLQEIPSAEHIFAGLPVQHRQQDRAARLSLGIS